MSRLFGSHWHRLLVCSQHNGVFLGRRSEAQEGDGDREDSHVPSVKVLSTLVLCLQDVPQSPSLVVQPRGTGP